MKKFLITILLTMSLISFTAELTAFAFEIPVIPRPDTIPGPDVSPEDTRSGRKALVENILPKYAVSLIGFVGAAALVFLVISGVRYAMAFGEEEAVKKAKDQMIYALVGFVIALLSYTIVTIIANLKFEGDTSTGAAATEESTPATASPTPQL